MSRTRRRVDRPRTASISIALALGVCLAASGQDEKARPAPEAAISEGTIVVLKAPDTPVRGDGDHRPHPIRRGTDLKVQRIDGDRLLVASPAGRHSDWVGIGQVIPLGRAMEHFDRAIAGNPGDVDALRMRGRLWADLGEFDRALADLDRAIGLAPDRASAYLDRGDLGERRGQLDRAIADFAEAIRLDPRDSRGFSRRGNALGRRGDLDRAIADFNEAIRLDPEDPWALRDRGFFHARKGDLDAAIADFTEAIKIDAKNGSSRTSTSSTATASS